MFNHENLKKRIHLYSQTTFGSAFEELLDTEKYVVVSKAIMENVLPLWEESRKALKGKRRAYYLSSEYLMGRFLTNNLISIGVKNEVEVLLKEMGIDYNSIEESDRKSVV